MNAGPLLLILFDSQRALSARSLLSLCILYFALFVTVVRFSVYVISISARNIGLCFVWFPGWGLVLLLSEDQSFYLEKR
jgi:hypothetical protein